MASPIEVRFTLTRREYVTSTRWITWRTRRLRLILCGVLALIGTVVGFASLVQPGPPSPACWALALPAVYLVLILRIWIQPGLKYRQLPAAFRDEENVWRFSEEGVEYRGATSEGKALWSSWIGFDESRDCFLLFVLKHQAHIIPKRAFGTPEEIDRFRDLARRRIPPSSGSPT